MTDYELVQECIHNNAKYQRILFDRYAGKMLTVCLRYANDHTEAEDMLQEGLVRVFKNLHQFKFEGSFEGWVRRIVVNSALKHLQKKRLNFSDIDDNKQNAPRVDNYVMSNVGEEELLKLISQLPDGYRIVFNLNVIEGYSHEEIAQMLNIQPSTSRSQLVKARKLLQQQILDLQKIAV